jgi:hypothetical protein
LLNQAARELGSMLCRRGQWGCKDRSGKTDKCNQTHAPAGGGGRRTTHFLMPWELKSTKLVLSGIRN